LVQERARDEENNRVLEAAGWVVLRFWETDVLRAPKQIVDCVAHVLEHLIIDEAQDVMGPRADLI